MVGIGKEGYNMVGRNIFKKDGQSSRMSKNHQKRWKTFRNNSNLQVGWNPKDWQKKLRKDIKSSKRFKNIHVG